MTRLTLLAAILASPAQADATRVWPITHPSIHRPSVIELHAPTAPNAVASVTFQNEPVHTQDETFTLTWGDITVKVIFDWQVTESGHERAEVIPPEGMVAVPPFLTVPEFDTQTLHIYEWEGM